MESCKRYPLLVLLGPTGVGKTGLSLKIARRMKFEIISADSMQIYRGMDIGTAKVSNEDRKVVRHHMIDIIEPDDDFSVADYKTLVDKLIPEIVKRGTRPMLVGGTGLYIKSVMRGFLFPEMKINKKLRSQLFQEAEDKGNIYIHNKLKEIDPELADKLHPNDLRRVIRGIEVYEETGKTTSYFKKKQTETPDRYKSLKIGLHRERSELYKRINQRVDKMIEDGLIEEVERLLEDGFKISGTALQGLGYKEIISYLKGEYDLAEAVRVLKRDTRHYAKRQLTWFRRDKSIKWINLSLLDSEEALKEIINYINESELFF
ncbi:tRNA (adenosine(37)-N6)-dimethylallyltransferase MiaA [Halocella sp. SP3-1]|uniref:tRNA (adenosine(37)-N6)-dimethylallyltransferase MiaA n=1 Tax=Halocella sp. SP3-1 TaxID=2382161 RepID=UPI000F74EC07|nr:tRNA (adenosine(37)-N6)-dimethylallyltransferase MiaA [Halocella sp. SP3-1]AZO95421.1 tRNA (adenosine(37)-N6)-dimethylallyltransferase MiaA [Halocella sp. SP3-1]